MALWQDKCNRLDFAYRGYQYPVPPSWKYAVRLEDQIQWLLQAILKAADEAVSAGDLMDFRNEMYDFIDRVAAALEEEIEEYSHRRAWCYSPVDGALRPMGVVARQVYDAARPLAMRYREFDGIGMTYDELKAEGRKYNDVDFHSNLYWGNGNLLANTTPADAISDPVAGEPGAWNPTGGGYSKGTTYSQINENGFMYRKEA